jgi:NAD(P)-dependent dehydrogenase (short-subunit alcohol dehydrogenase family)
MTTDITGHQLRGQVAIVTGAASGIGEAIVRRFQAEGGRVVAIGLQPERLAALAQDTGCTWRECDVAQSDSVEKAVQQAVESQGRIDIVVNAAGIMQVDDVANIEDAVWARMFDVNLTGAMRVCRAALPAMVERGSGSVVNVASVAAFNASAGMASYAASKAGLVALTRAMANRYGADGIRANTICPGWVRTPMSEAEMQDTARARGTIAETEFAELTSRIALRRIGDPEEIAACALFLASREASFVTGAVLVADGGARSATAARAF